MKVVFQIQVARGALVCVSACLDWALDKAVTRDTAVEEPEEDDLRIHKQLESDGPMAARTSGSENFIAARRGKTKGWPKESNESDRLRQQTRCAGWSTTGNERI